MLPNDTTYSSKNIFIFPPQAPSGFKDFLRRQDEAFMFDVNEVATDIYIQAKHTRHVVGKGTFYNMLAENNIIEAHQIKAHNNDWMTGLLLIIFLGLALLQKVFFKPLRYIFSAFYSHRHTHLLNRDGNILDEFHFYVLVFLSFLSLSLTFYLSPLILFPLTTSQQMLLFIKIFTSLIVLYLIKLIVVFILGNIFNMQRLFGEWLLAQKLFIIVPAIFFLILSTLYIYTGYQFIYLSTFLLVGIIFILYLFRLFIVSRAYGNANMFHFFIYLCTVEILPVLFIYKLLKTNSKC